MRLEEPDQDAPAADALLEALPASLALTKARPAAGRMCEFAVVFVHVFRFRIMCHLRWEDFAGNHWPSRQRIARRLYMRAACAVGRLPGWLAGWLHSRLVDGTRKQWGVHAEVGERHNSPSLSSFIIHRSYLPALWCSDWTMRVAPTFGDLLPASETWDRPTLLSPRPHAPPAPRACALHYNFI